MLEITKNVERGISSKIICHVLQNQIFVVNPLENIIANQACIWKYFKIFLVFL